MSTYNHGTLFKGQQGEELSGELDFHHGFLCAEAGSGLVMDVDASCLQGGDLLVAGLGAEGIAAQAYLIAFPKSSVDN